MKLWISTLLAVFLTSHPVMSHGRLRLITKKMPAWSWDSQMGCGGSELIVCSAHSPHDQKSFNKRIAFCASTRPQASAEPIDLTSSTTPSAGAETSAAQDSYDPTAGRWR
jgi:hypothetical protein